MSAGCCGAQPEMRSGGEQAVARSLLPLPLLFGKEPWEPKNFKPGLRGRWKKQVLGAPESRVCLAWGRLDEKMGVISTLSPDLMGTLLVLIYISVVVRNKNFSNFSL